MKHYNWRSNMRQCAKDIRDHVALMVITQQSTMTAPMTHLDDSGAMKTAQEK